MADFVWTSVKLRIAKEVFRDLFWQVYLKWMNDFEPMVPVNERPQIDQALRDVWEYIRHIPLDENTQRNIDDIENRFQYVRDLITRVQIPTND
jgi:hypothetical protein